jgi:hypothetical protein
MNIVMNKGLIAIDKVEVIEVKSNIANFNLELDLDMKIENLPKISEGIINQEIITFASLAFDLQASCL